MMVIRFQPNNWRPDSRTLISTGDYRIPLDMSEELANRALSEGVAIVVRETKPAGRRLEFKRSAPPPSNES